MNVKKRCSCEEACDHPYHFKFKHKGREIRETTHTANYRLACRIAERRHKTIVGRAAGVGAAVDIERVRLSELHAKYDEWVEGSHRAAARSKTIVARFCEFFPDDPYLVDLQAFDLERFRSARLKAVKRTTVHGQFGIVQGFFRQAAIWYPGFLRPDAGVSPWRPDEAEMVILTPEELRYTLTELPPLLALICRVTLETLARIDEVVSLTIHEVGPNWMTRRLKGGKRLRVAIPEALATDLRALARPGQLRLFEVERHRRGQPSVWHPLSGGNVSGRFYKWFRKHKLAHLHHHSYRHTGISLMLDAGMNPKAIQQLAGWTTLQMLPRYGHVGDREMRRAVLGNAAHLAAVLRGENPAAAAEGEPTAKATPEANRGHTKGHTATRQIRK
jgi:integrase